MRPADSSDPAKIKNDECCGEPPEFQALDEARMGVALDRLTLESVLTRTKQQATDIRQRAQRLAARDERNGYVEMMRLAIGAVR